MKIYNKIKKGCVMRRENFNELFKRFDELKEQIEQGIEKNRKGNCAITLVDKNGSAITNAKIHINQKSHQFKFGANLFMLDELETKEKNEAYKKHFADTFNMATLPFYWNSLEPEKGKTRYEKNSPKIYRRPAIDLCIEFCEKHNIEPREHALAYEFMFPSWLSGLSVTEVKAELERRYKEIAERYKDKIPTIEVTNEMAREKGVTSFYNQPDFLEWCYKTAEKYFPNNQLVVNDYISWDDCGRTTDKYYSYIENTILKGGRIDAIGFQYHLFHKKEEEPECLSKNVFNPCFLLNLFDMYSLLKRPLQITEITIPSFSWEEEDEQIQAELLERLYSLWFSHENMEQIVYWNLVDGYCHVWDNDPKTIRETQGNMSIGENYHHGGLLRFDLTPKPAFLKLQELIKKRWHTETIIISNENGACSFKGFYGEYELEIEVNGKKEKRRASLLKNQDNNIRVVL